MEENVEAVPKQNKLESLAVELQRSGIWRKLVGQNSGQARRATEDESCVLDFPRNCSI